MSLMNQFIARILPAIFGISLAFFCLLRASAEPVRWTNSLGQVFVPVPGTKVWFSIWETRVKDFAAFAGTNPKLNGTNWNHSFYHDVTPVSDGPDYPVVDVSWNDAQAFCRWLTDTERQSGKIPAGARYRLPTDEEWSV